MVSGKQNKTGSEKKQEKKIRTGKTKKRIGCTNKIRISQEGSHLEKYFLMLVHAHKIKEPVREYKFHPDRRWRFDFAWVDEMIAVEIEGGVWTGGGHTRGKGYIKDCEKYNNATLLGWRLLRFAGDNIDIEMVKKMLL